MDGHRRLSFPACLLLHYCATGLTATRGQDTRSSDLPALLRKSMSRERSLCMQDTYRYHGHSISDPGSTYRTRDEIQGIRQARDPIDRVRSLIIEHGFADASELKALENAIKKVRYYEHIITRSIYWKLHCDFTKVPSVISHCIR